MYRGDYHTERKWNGKKVIIDIAELRSNVFEIMILYANGNEIEAYTADNLEDAIAIYHDMLERYPESSNAKPRRNESPAPLTGKYAKLRDDLKVALEASKAADVGEDGGTCNFDSPSIYLPRWIESKVKQAAKEAGTRCFKWKLFGGAMYVFNPRSSGQANRRCRASEAMEKALQEAGYECVMYCQMD